MRQTMRRLTISEIDERIDAIRNDPGESFWLRSQLLQAQTRDPVDAARDAHSLASLLQQRAECILHQGRQCADFTVANLERIGYQVQTA